MRTTRLLRNRLLGAMRRLAGPAARWQAERRPPVVQLASVQRRLELLLGAMYGQPMRIVSRAPGVTPAATDVVLPASLPGRDEALARYRLLAIEQGARIARGTRAAAPADALEADFFMVLEGAAVDAEIAARAPGLRGAMRALRDEELRKRPGMHRLVPQQREVERALRALLESEPGVAIASLARTATAKESAEVARALVARMRNETSTRIRYRPIASVDLWDDSLAMGRRSRVELMTLTDFQIAKLGVAESDDGSDGETPTPEGSAEMEGEGADDDTGEATPAGEQSGSAGSAGEHDDPEGADTTDPRDGPDVWSEASTRAGVPYPEWIARHGRLEPRHATVHAAEAAERGGEWARWALHEHGPLLRQVRDRFSLLRAQRLRLRAQRAGDELDLDACVAALVDMQLGRVPTDRVYQTTRATRHSLAIAILVDVSGSTKTLLPDGRSVLDVERLSLLLASEALDALGDPYAILTFSGLGRHDVRVATVKGFAEHDRGAVHRRISSLEPQDNTRLGAAVRHATALLGAQPAGRKVLLLLSDGRPNDVDRYQGVDAIEDSRQAVLAARAQGVTSFCLTVDTEEADYLPHLFGAGGYQVISRPAHLPTALIRLVDRLLRG